ncbi:MAG: hypothetical protein JSV88_28510 [Candidatus Aminicenantes bacterium]|nr:MAG: hypothetical protein JSV88_28510 [Candidatus Aminicenantes bacterium]
MKMYTDIYPQFLEKAKGVAEAYGLTINKIDLRHLDYPAVSDGFMMRILLDRCKNVEEAIKLLERVPVWFPWALTHFLLADREGNSVIVEFNQENGKVVSISRKGNYQILTNTSLLIGVPKVRTICQRYKTAEDVIKKGINSPEAMFNVMRKIFPSSSSRSKSYWTSIADLSKNEMLVYFWMEKYKKAHRFHLD